MNFFHICLLSLSLFCNIVPQVRNLNLILLIDTNAEPQIGGPLTGEFSIAIAQKAAPIIVSESVLYFFLNTKKNFDKFPEYLNKLPKKKLQEIEAKLPDLLAKLEKTSYAFYTVEGILDPINEFKKIITELNSYNIATELIHEIQPLIEKLEKHIADYPKTYDKSPPESTESIYLSLPIAKLAFEIKNIVYNINHEIKEYLENKFYAHIAFNLNEWHLFKHAQAPLYLLLPKNYEEQTKKEYETYKASLKEIQRKRAELEKTKEAIGPEEYKKQVEMLELVTTGPKEQKTEVETKVAAQYSPREMALGLKIDHANLLTPLTFTSVTDMFNFVARDIEQKAGMSVLLSAPPEFPYQELEQFFVEGQSPELGAWNIYMGGHGTYATMQQHIKLETEHELEQYKKLLSQVQEKIKEVNQPELKVTAEEQEKLAREYNKLFILDLAIYAKDSIFNPRPEEAEKFLEMLNNKDEGLAATAKSAGLDWEKLTNKQNMANYLTMLVDKLTKMAQQIAQGVSKEHETKKEREIYTASVAGLYFGYFLDFIHFLYRSVQTSFLYVITCFGGGFNMQEIVKYVQTLESEEQRILKAISPSFIIAMGALPDVSVAGITLEVPFPLHFDDFFADLKKFYSRQMPFKEDPIKTILKNIMLRERGEPIKGGFAEERHGISSVASIYFPGRGIIRAPEVDKEIMVLTFAKLKALELVIPRKKEKVEPIDTRGKSAVLIYPTEIHAPVILGFDSKSQATALVPMLSNEVHFDFIASTQNKKPLNLKTFLVHSIMDTRSIVPRTFTIKKLLCNNYKKSGLDGKILELSDVFIKSAVTFQAKSETITWDVLFTLNGKIYHGTMIDMYENPEDFEGRFITNPEWKEITQEEAEKMRKET